MDVLSNYQIERFFKVVSPVTREICDGEAAAIANNRIVKLTSMQGSQSYTELVGDDTNGFIFQFRDLNSPLDMTVLKAAKETYGRLVPECRRLQGRLDPLHVYKMNDVSGESLLLARTSPHLPGNSPLLERTVEDFAI